MLRNLCKFFGVFSLDYTSHQTSDDPPKLLPLTLLIEKRVLFGDFERENRKSLLS